MGNSIEGAIDIDILAVLILPLTIDTVISEQLTLPLKLKSQNCHWLTKNWHWFKQIPKVDIAIDIEIALEKQLTVKPSCFHCHHNSIPLLGDCRIEMTVNTSLSPYFYTNFWGAYNWGDSQNMIFSLSP